MCGQRGPTPFAKTTPAGTGGSRCCGCPAGDCTGEEGSEERGVAGWRLALVSTGLFLGPVILAVVGAASTGESAGMQFAGALGGLSLGLAASVGIARMLHRGREKTP